MSIVDAEKAIRLVLDGIISGLCGGEDVIIRGFGRFKFQRKAERMGRNPKTGEPAVVTARCRVGFKASKELNGRVNQ